jgi:uncharacterized membrane protein YheB (UPF0754 family)
VEKGANKFKRVTVKLSGELYEEIRKLAGGRVSAWISEKLERVVREERAKQLFEALPPEIRRKLLERAGGDERKAAELALRLLNLALEEAEEEEAAQEAIAYANLKERRGG